MIVELALERKYALTREVMLAALFFGTLKVANGFAKACVTGFPAIVSSPTLALLAASSSVAN